jgi:hypothetical protein
MTLMPWLIRGVIAAAVIAAVACRSAERDGTAKSASTGVAEWHIETTPNLRIGSDNGDTLYQFSTIDHALRLPDGRIVVAHAGTELRVFDRDGRHQVTIGRAGQGPGEFSRIAWLGATGGDTLLVYDRRLLRLSKTTADGGHIGSTQLELPAQLAMVGAMGDQGFVVGPIVRRWIERPDRTEYSEEEYLLVSRDGRSVRPIISTEGPAYFVVTFQNGGRGQRDIPFTPIPHAVVWGERVALTKSTSYTIDLFRFDGTLDQTISQAVRQREVTQADLARYRDEALRDLPAGPGPKEQFDQLLAQMPKPAHFPVIDGLLVDSENQLWVLRYEPFAATVQHWDVFAPSGSLVATATTPANVRVTEIGAAHILGVETDSLDVPRVVVVFLSRR